MTDQDAGATDPFDRVFDVSNVVVQRPSDRRFVAFARPVAAEADRVYLEAARLEDRQEMDIPDPGAAAGPVYEQEGPTSGCLRGHAADGLPSWYER